MDKERLLEILKSMSIDELFGTYSKDHLKSLERDYNIELIIDPNSKATKDSKKEIEKYKSRFTSDTGPR